MSKLKTITKGFKARKGQMTYEVRVEIFRLGFYIHITNNGNQVNTLHRVKLKKASEAVLKERHSILKRGYEITDLGEYRVAYDEKTLTYKIQI